jgi:RNA recognition motif-containing protein
MDSGGTPTKQRKVEPEPHKKGGQAPAPVASRPSTEATVAATLAKARPKKPDDDSRNLLTVFVSNLEFKVDEKKLEDIFSQFGEIKEVRLVRNFKGLSKGYAYIEFTTIESVKKALKSDRMKIEDRPTFISELDKRTKFKYPSEIEKNKLFVKNLAPEVTESDLRKVFEKYGGLKDIRIVTYRNGHSKGSAYVEFVDELTASQALKADAMLLAGRNIEVAISNPAASKKPKEPYSAPKVLGAISLTLPAPDARRQRVNVPMIPASVRRQQQLKQHRNGGGMASNGSGDQATVSQPSASTSAMSNNDFRQLLNK